MGLTLSLKCANSHPHAARGFGDRADCPKAGWLIRHQNKLALDLVVVYPRIPPVGMITAMCRFNRNDVRPIVDYHGDK